MSMFSGEAQSSQEEGKLKQEKSDKAEKEGDDDGAWS